MTKRSGEREEFNEGKVKRAILRVGVTDAVAGDILETVKRDLYNGITTEEIYRMVHQLLDRKKAVRFGLKEAMLDLGPDGHYFESFVGKMFQTLDHSVRLRERVQGMCVAHEVDAIVEKGAERYMVECKFHNSPGMKCNIQTALYTYARYLDVNESLPCISPWLVTNTKFTTDAIQYAKCMGMRLLGWRYPEERSLENLIDEHRLYPLTFLGLKKAYERSLLDRNFILLRDVVNNKECLYELLPEKDAEAVLLRAKEMLS
ncbi:MAG: restriction endonuclease [Methanomassiliicoccales archaeon]|nr:restriction endonuclease [Methanomassiliicoccales archaeon]